VRGAKKSSCEVGHFAGAAGDLKSKHRPVGARRAHDKRQLHPAINAGLKDLAKLLLGLPVGALTRSTQRTDTPAFAAARSGGSASKPKGPTAEPSCYFAPKSCLPAPVTTWRGWPRPLGQRTPQPGCRLLATMPRRDSAESVGGVFLAWAAIAAPPTSQARERIHSKSNNATQAGATPAMATVITAVAAFSASRLIGSSSTQHNNALSTSPVAHVLATGRLPVKKKKPRQRGALEVAKKKDAQFILETCLRDDSEAGRDGGLEAKIAQRQGCPVDRVPGLKCSVFEMCTGSTDHPAVYGI
jgi:hypothetical protein